MWVDLDLDSTEIVGQGQMPKIVFWHHCYFALRLRSKVTGEGQTSESRSNNFCAAVGIRSSALPSAVKSTNHMQYWSKEESLQSRVFCVSAYSAHMWIIVRSAFDS